MAINFPKPSHLSPLQAKVYDALTQTPHSRPRIAEVSGISQDSLWRWTKGLNEPKEANVEAVLEAIKKLDGTNPPFRWKNHVERLRELRAKGFSNKRIALIMHKTKFSVDNAMSRYLNKQAA